MGRGFDLWLRMRTFVGPMAPPPAAAECVPTGGGAPDSNNKLSAAPTAWGRPKAGLLLHEKQVVEHA